MAQSLHFIEPVMKTQTRRRVQAWVATEALMSLAIIVGDMHHQFCDHIARQEGDTGFLTVLTRAAPRYLSMLEHIQLEHAALAAEMAELRLRILTAAPDELDRLAAAANALADAVAEHDALEREMLEDALDSGVAA